MTTSNDTNKVKYGLRNVHLFEITDSGTKLTYGTPVPWRGATELTLDPNGDALEVHADDIIYDKEENNQGYTGKLTMLYLQPEIEALLFGNVENADGVVVENADNHGSKVAMAFEFSGDKKHVRHVLYNVSFSRAGDGSATKSDKIDAQTANFQQWQTLMTTRLRVRLHKDLLSTTTGLLLFTYLAQAHQRFNDWPGKPGIHIENRNGAMTCKRQSLLEIRK